ncbi:MAG: hypothetical protein WC876_04900 [Candidatus Thermoplasmatota archaeon]|jgi:hypothetical protein
MARAWLTSAVLVLVTVAGCSAPADKDTGPSVNLPPLVSVMTIQVEDAMTFSQSVVSEAQAVGQDLYEPTMEVSDTGAIYVAAHVIGAATTGTPAYISTDDGATWKQLPAIGPVSFPAPVQGGQPPPGDEGFIVAGDDGEAWMADIYLGGFSVTGWCGDGAEQCYDNRQAYDRITSTSEMCADGDAQSSTAGSLNDRPWAAYAPGVGSLLLVNNPGGGPMQIGVMQVPPATPVGSSDPVTGPRWNLCASPDGYIPGVPAMRADGFFAVPQMTGMGTDDERLTVVLGNVADIFAVEVKDVFDVTSDYGGTSNGGRTAFDGAGALYVGAYNNTEGANTDKDKGQFVLATSSDDGQRFVNVTFVTDTPVRSLYLDSNLHGPGALLTWSQLGSTNTTDANGDVMYTKSDWYVAHVNVGPNGEPVLSHVTLAVNEGPHSSAHVMGASLGPDGRAYFVNFSDEGDLVSYIGSTPLSVWIQQDGPTL